MTKVAVSDLGTMSHVEALLAAVGPVAGMQIIDIGCGEGQMARALAGLGAHVTGYDPFIEGAGSTEQGAGSFRLARAPADAIPAPDGSADLVLFIFSLHHVPDSKHAGAMAEARRLLRPSGSLYVAEPLAEGPGHYVTAPFHDETLVRREAAASLVRYAAPQFASERVVVYNEGRSFPDFDSFAERMIESMRFNDYTEDAILAPEVRRRFEEIMISRNGSFDQPVRVNIFR
jgi:ubiquinone/menaquinone biosynthesis C-methylase UbiE